MTGFLSIRIRIASLFLKAVVRARNQAVPGRVREAREGPLTKPVELGFERLYLPRLCAGEVDETASGGDALHSPGGLLRGSRIAKYP